MKIKIRKLSETENPNFPSAKKEEHICGGINDRNVSLFVDYEVIGLTDYLPKVGSYFSMWRIKRNGVEALGLFSTSLVKKIEGNKFYTENSIYQWEELND